MKEFKPRELIEGIEDIELIKKLPTEYLEEKVVLGIDIYKYSQYPSVQQNYIPVLFDQIYSYTVNNIKSLEPFLFGKYTSEKKFKQNFISTGDGGFQIFDNPLQAIIFALWFQANVKRYCSGGNVHPFAKKLYKIVDHIELRYAITTDDIFSYSSNFFGPAIINNSRILSRDSLNRLLIDDNTVKWFSKNMNSIENLIDIDCASLITTLAFNKESSVPKSLIFEKSGTIKTVDLLKVGKIKAKTTELDIFNLQIQAQLNLKVEHHAYTQFIVTLGNLNTSGINNL